MELTTRFCVLIYHFQSVLLLRYYNDKKAYRILAVLPFNMSAALAGMGLAMEPGVQTMSDELIL